MSYKILFFLSILIYSIHLNGQNTSVFQKYIEYEDSLFNKIAEENEDDFYPVAIDKAQSLFASDKDLACHIYYKAFERKEVFTYKFREIVDLSEYLEECKESINPIIEFEYSNVESYQSIFEENSEKYKGITENQIKDFEEIKNESGSEEIVYNILAHSLWNSLLFDDTYELSEELDSMLTDNPKNIDLPNLVRMFHYDHYKKYYELTVYADELIDNTTGAEKNRWISNKLSILYDIEDWKEIEKLVPESLQSCGKEDSIYFSFFLGYSYIHQNKVNELERVVNELSKNDSYIIENPNLRVWYWLIKGRYLNLINEKEKAIILFEKILENTKNIDDVIKSETMEIMMSLDPKYESIENHIYLADSIHNINKNNGSIFSMSALSEHYADTDPEKSSEYKSRMLEYKENRSNLLRNYFEKQKNALTINENKVAQQDEYFKYILYVMIGIGILLIYLIFKLFKTNKERQDLATINSWYIKKAMEMEKLFKGQRSYFSHFAHDIRGPLENLKSLQSQIENKKNDISSIREKSKLLSSNIENQINNLNNYLYQKNITSDEELESIKISDILKEAELLIDEKIVRPYALNISGSKTINGYSNSLKIIFKNLLENTFKHNSSDPEIYLAVNDEDQKVRFEYWDNGKLEQSRNMERKNHAEHSFGLGLKICEAIVSKHGGKFNTNSNFKDGFKVDFEI